MPLSIFKRIGEAIREKVVPQSVPAAASAAEKPAADKLAASRQGRHRDSRQSADRSPRRAGGSQTRPQASERDDKSPRSGSNRPPRGERPPQEPRARGSERPPREQRVQGANRPPRAERPPREPRVQGANRPPRAERPPREPRAQGASHPPRDGRPAREPRDAEVVRPPRSEPDTMTAVAPTPPKPWTLDDFQVTPEEGRVRFHDLDLPVEIMHAVADLKFKYCTPIQAACLAKARAGENIAGRAQTGTGKTAAFLIAILARYLRSPEGRADKPGTPRALVIAPTRELCVQLCNDAKDLGKYCGLRSLAVFGGMDYTRQQRQLADGPVDLLAATPGRLLDFQRQRIVDLSNVDTLVIDEADRMLDMGFIPDVRRIIRCLPEKSQRQTMLFSATLDDSVMRLATQWMPNPVKIEIEPEHVAADNITQKVLIVTASQKFTVLCNLLKRHAGERVLIFGNRRSSTDRLAMHLTRNGFPCELLSGDVQQSRRMRVLEDFRSGTTKIVVATDVAGRGLHIADIGLVVNFELPYEAEDYVHRIGRTGRAGKVGTAVSFACEDESFQIPAIEKYMGEDLKCTIPENELLNPLPPPTSGPPRGGREGDRENSERDRGPRDGRSDRGSSGNRGDRTPRGAMRPPRDGRDRELSRRDGQRQPRRDDERASDSEAAVASAPVGTSEAKPNAAAAAATPDNVAVAAGVFASTTAKAPQPAAMQDSAVAVAKPAVAEDGADHHKPAARPDAVAAEAFTGTVASKPENKPDNAASTVKPAVPAGAATVKPAAVTAASAPTAGRRAEKSKTADAPGKAPSSQSRRENRSPAPAGTSRRRRDDASRRRRDDDDEPRRPSRPIPPPSIATEPSHAFTQTWVPGTGKKDE